MLMPFGSAFAVGNLGVPLTQLPLVTTVAWMNPARANGTGYNKRTCCGRA
jgi:hypothetical protein